MDGGGVKHLVALGSVEVGLEHAESEVVLLLSSICFFEFRFEDGEVVLHVQEIMIVGTVVR